MEVEFQGIGEYHNLFDPSINPSRVELCFLGCSEEGAEG